MDANGHGNQHIHRRLTKT